MTRSDQYDYVRDRALSISGNIGEMIGDGDVPESWTELELSWLLARKARQQFTLPPEHHEAYGKFVKHIEAIEEMRAEERAE
jgi:hypothetical protein